MSTIAITDDTFADTVAKDGIVLVDFWADWCGPCHMFSPVFEASSEKNTDVIHAKVDTEEARGVSQAFAVTSIPTLMAFRDGVMVFRQAGALPPASLQQIVDAVGELDMDDVRKQIAERESAT